MEEIKDKRAVGPDGPLCSLPDMSMRIDKARANDVVRGVYPFCSWRDAQSAVVRLIDGSDSIVSDEEGGIAQRGRCLSIFVESDDSRVLKQYGSGEHASSEERGNCKVSQHLGCFQRMSLVDIALIPETEIAIPRNTDRSALYIYLNYTNSSLLGEDFIARPLGLIDSSVLDSIARQLSRK